MNDLAIQKLEIPKDQLKSHGDEFQFVEVIVIKAILENSVRLYVPESKDVQEVVLNLPSVIQSSR